MGGHDDPAKSADSVTFRESDWLDHHRPLSSFFLSHKCPSRSRILLLFVRVLLAACFYCPHVPGTRIGHEPGSKVGYLSSYLTPYRQGYEAVSTLPYDVCRQNIIVDASRPAALPAAGLVIFQHLLPQQQQSRSTAMSKIPSSSFPSRPPSGLTPILFFSFTIVISLRC